MALTERSFDDKSRYFKLGSLERVKAYTEESVMYVLIRSSSLYKAISTSSFIMRMILIKF